ncbi:C4-dicarboxylate transporter [Azoarcus indigens]|uniref:TRAP-type C4-dicarboxylate transport system substrate-binding protein n=1 Tax=Azoarcus indigens TaxID=29545 RepID=A0A4R6DUJ8_9RHOO|nr:TRAP transporter substrate-binding protein [Azoarcus indigens]NMG64990.1 C4-dicarboxylate transporter [Azoarcus indigens]TDN48885.1 TRAP-type C4-dicarboxylate transport system substrate-binding protein [Azoarcus indigens]
MNKRLLVAASACVLSLPAFAQEVTLKIAHFLPSVAPAQQQVMQPWCDALAKDSGGRIKCQFFPAMQLGGTPAQLADQVKNGVADVVWTAPGYSAGRFPLVEALELPFVVSDASSGSRAAWSYYEQYAKAEFDAYKVLAVHVDGGVALHTAKKPVKGLADIAGLKLRAPTRMASKTLAALGGEPVAMPPAQVTEAIAKGVVDGAMGAWEVVLPTKLDEVAKFHAQPAAGKPYPSTTVLALLMNKQKYDSLPADLKAVVDKHSGAALVANFGRVWDEVATATRAKVASHGNAVVQLSDADLEAMKKAAQPVEEEWVKQVSAKGVDGRKLADAARALASGQ